MGTAHTRRLVAEHIRRVLDDDAPGLDWLRRGVRRHGFLPLYLGWLEVLGVRPDGTLVRWPSEDEPERLYELTEPYWQRMALAAGAVKFPELRSLLPERPVEAADCETCKGTGRLQGHPHLICVCGGIGWRLPGERYSPSPA